MFNLYKHELTFFLCTIKNLVCILYLHLNSDAKFSEIIDLHLGFINLRAEKVESYTQVVPNIFKSC